MFFGALAEFERDLVRDRTQAGLSAARVRGHRGGRPRIMDERKIALAESLHRDARHSPREICAKCQPAVVSGNLLNVVLQAVNIVAANTLGNLGAVRPPSGEPAQMKCRLQVIMETDAGEEIHDIACLERNANRLEEIGLTLADARDLLARVQKAVVEQQITDYLAARQCCGDCGKLLLHKGSHQITFRTLFGNLEIESPRLFHCKCQPHGNRTFSPLTELLPEHIAPERLYLETKWASLISFELAAKLLGEVLPIQEHVNGATVRCHLHEVAERSEAALGEEQFSFITGCPAGVEGARCLGRQLR